MHRTFTSGAARRADIASRYVYAPMIVKPGADGELEFRTEADAENEVTIEQVNGHHFEGGRINPILDIFRDQTYKGDPDIGYHAHEWLFQLARHWSEWQSPRIGTFPLDYRDPSGPLTREESEETREDQAYWEIEAVLDEAGNTFPDADAQQDYIVHATAVLTRLLAQHPID